VASCDGKRFCGRTTIGLPELACVRLGFRRLVRKHRNEPRTWAKACRWAVGHPAVLASTGTDCGIVRAHPREGCALDRRQYGLRRVSWPIQRLPRVPRPRTDGVGVSVGVLGIQVARLARASARPSRRRRPRVLARKRAREKTQLSPCGHPILPHAQPTGHTPFHPILPHSAHASVAILPIFCRSSTGFCRCHPFLPSFCQESAQFTLFCHCSATLLPVFCR